MAHRNRVALERLLDERSATEPVRKLVASLPASLLQTKPPDQILEELVHLAALPEAGCLVRIGWQPATSMLAVTVGTRESVAPGIFHRLAGALSSLRLGILAADIHTFGDGLVLDHFSLQDPDFQGEPPGHRLMEIEEAIRRSLEPSSHPSFRRVWGVADMAATGPAPRVRIDNESSDTTTILEVFADDSPGLLYAIAKAIFESGLSVRSAKIGTYLDQVVDAFHVTDGSNCKISDPRMLDDLRSAVQSAIATLCR
jgi:[protein-PII] uridylyltransferase